MISIQNISKQFKGVSVLKNVTLEIKKGEVVGLIGPSGAGKSTLLRCIVNLEPIDEGCICIDKKKISNKGIQTKTGIVFQNFNLFPQINVLENITLAPRIVRGVSKKNADQQARRLLLKVGLFDKATQFPSELSGGQIQRVAIARALAMNPEVLLFDEPTSALDPELTNEVLSVIKELAKENMTIVIASHEMNFIKQIADKVIFMEQGKIVTSGTPKDIFDGQTNTRIKKFIQLFN